MESPLIISPLNLSATAILSFVFPTAGVRTIALTVSLLCIALDVFICIIHVMRYHQLDKLQGCNWAVQSDSLSLRVDLDTVNRLFLEPVVCVLVLFRRQLVDNPDA